ncbi:MAG TPA: acetoin dehydrogenase dihydrolipoyllysine-residue acetyltransferase subunit [Chloroflexota bacterium]|nr:acetoin dehydrogenase dihydrolipoyllysine-residue acetyltransferase subunit [Chloroflexota bacterium]
MPILVKMPKWGLTMKVGTVTEWLRPEGAEVKAGEPLLMVESDKAANEVEAPRAGTLRKIVAAEGAEVPVSAPVAVLAAPGETLSDEEIEAFLAGLAQQQAAGAARAAGARVTREARAAARDEQGRVNASPAARKLAQELGVDLSAVTATGPGGRITSDDVQRAFDEQGGVREDYVTLRDGRRLFYVLAGPATAPPLVFIHGLGGSQLTWQNILGDLATEYRLCALDLPGHGQSDKSPPDGTRYTLADMAGAVAEVMDALGIAPATLVGHSLGGAVAMAVALEHPGRAARLVLIDSAGLGDEINPAMIDLIEAEPSHDESRRLLELFFHDHGYVIETSIQDNLRGRLAEGERPAVQAAMDANFSRQGQHTGLPARLGQLALPVLILWGADDEVIPAAHARQGAQAIAGAQAEIFPATGHVPQIEAAAGVVQAIRRFVPAG